jgi:hypothetical protein
MSLPPIPTPHEPSLKTIELLCERLGELGLPIGPDTARELLQAILEVEAPRVDAHVRESLQVSLDTIRIAAQAAHGLLASTTPVETRPKPSGPPKPVLDPMPRRAPASPTRPATPRRPARRPEAESLDTAPDAPPPEPPRRPRRDSGGEPRPVFRRPRGR